MDMVFQGRVFFFLTAISIGGRIPHNNNKNRQLKFSHISSIIASF
jgi:hypothetical protein